MPTRKGKKKRQIRAFSLLDLILYGGYPKAAESKHSFKSRSAPTSKKFDPSASVFHFVDPHDLSAFMGKKEKDKVAAKVREGVRQQVFHIDEIKKALGEHGIVPLTDDEAVKAFA